MEENKLVVATMSGSLSKDKGTHLDGLWCAAKLKQPFDENLLF